MRGYPSYRRPSNRARRATTLVGGFAVLLLLFLLSREAGFVAWGLEPVGPSIAQPLQPTMPHGPGLHTTPVTAEVSPLRPAQEMWTEPEPAAKLTPRLSSPKGTPPIAEPRFKPIDLPALADPTEDLPGPKETTGLLSACDLSDCSDISHEDEDRLKEAVADVIDDGKGDDDPPGDVDDDGGSHDDGDVDHDGDHDGDGDCHDGKGDDDVAENEHHDGHDGDDDHHGHHGDGDGDHHGDGDDDDDGEDGDSGHSGSGGGHHHS